MSNGTDGPSGRGGGAGQGDGGSGASDPGLHSPRARAVRRIGRPAVELIGLAAVFALFSWLHNRAGSDVEAATRHALGLQALERALGVDIEVPANQWVAGHPWWIGASVIIYRTYYLPMVAVLLWVLLRHPIAFRKVRDVLLVMAAVALLVFWLLPMSPPRFALEGIVDIVALHDPVGGDASVDMANGQNHYSAMPSLHVGWSMLTAYAAWTVLRPRFPYAAVAVWLLPLSMVGVVIGTGNHYVLDVVAAGALLAFSIGLVTWWSRWDLPRAQRGRGLTDRVPRPSGGED